MTQKVTGKIDSMRKDRKGIQVNGTWYSAFLSTQLDAVKYGEEVEFVFEAVQKGDQVYNNIKGDVKPLGGSQPQQAAGAPTVQASSAVWPSPVDARGRQIIRQNSMGNAVAYAAAFMQDAGASPEDVVKVARVFEAYCTGESDNAPDDAPFNDDIGF